jgi:hypothetical protein
MKGLFGEAMGEEVNWERKVDLDATFIKPDPCSWHRDFLIEVLELNCRLRLHGDAHFQADLDCSKIVSQDDKVYCPISTTSNRLPLFA